MVLGFRSLFFKKVSDLADKYPSLAEKALAKAYKARSALYTLEFAPIPLVAELIEGKSFKELRNELPTLSDDLVELAEELFVADIQNIISGVYPFDVLEIESPVHHLYTLMKIYWDSLKAAQRRKKGIVAEFSNSSKVLLDALPDYYKTNYHYQTNGYLSEESAKLYDHQVELLFRGTADPMRRLIIEPMKNHFGKDHTGEGLRFLELGCGTGRATRFLSFAFPNAEIVACDLSLPYLFEAEKSWPDELRDITWRNADAQDISVSKFGKFDACYSVFLFHETPLSVREKILKASLETVKPGGFYGAVDSVQQGDEDLFEDSKEHFPQRFHEPYYKEYFENHLEKSFLSSGLGQIRSSQGFASKATWGVAGASELVK